jgi:hypothetical protein
MNIGLSILLSLLFLISASPETFATTSSQALADSNPIINESNQGWPRTIVSGVITILFYQPQIDRWQGDQIQACAAVSVKDSNFEQPAYGVVYFTMRTEVDKVNRLVTLDNFTITRVNFPTATTYSLEYLMIIQKAGDNQVATIALDRLQAELAAEQAKKRGASDRVGGHGGLGGRGGGGRRP